MRGPSFSSVYQMHLFMIGVFVVVTVFVLVYGKMLEHVTEEDFRQRHEPVPGTLRIQFAFHAQDREFGMVCEYRSDNWEPVGIVELDERHHVWDFLRWDDPAIRRHNDA